MAGLSGARRYGIKLPTDKDIRWVANSLKTFDQACRAAHAESEFSGNHKAVEIWLMPTRKTGVKRTAKRVAFLTAAEERPHNSEV
jgi:hypothetical protein